MLTGTLFVVSTPIGNLEDITLRALRVLKEVDFIVVEDTRRSLKLLNYYGISKPLISYWSAKEKVKTEVVIKKLRSGLSVALISDEGTPGISDPGYLLIKEAIEKNINITPIPGPSAFVAALSVAGLPAEEFTFIGFLPSKAAQRRKKLKELVLEPRTLVFYEASHRLLDTLSDMEEIFREREAAVAKEMTKIYEEILRGSISGILDMLEDRTIAGEYVIVVEESKRDGVTMDEALEEVRALIKKGKGRKEAVKSVAEEYGHSKKELYDKSLGYRL
ncbi:16S rRNA (cytidine(1402)-2'-O)-methyltransferase [Thermodesulfovibrionales bacterium]|nr:16S rRNA (cytidine(1402)-2'-O)-methyltransferase [Thermodesulfovibrionales bacterium]